MTRLTTTYWIRKGLVLLALTLAASQAWAAACDAVFTNGAQSHSSSGQVDLGYQVEITGGSRDIDTPTLITESPPGRASCGSGSAPCNATGNPAASGSVSFLYGDESDGDIDVTWFPFEGESHPEGDYGTVDVRDDRDLAFTTSGGTYYTKQFEFGQRGTLSLSSGDYWIDGDFIVDQDSQLENRDGGTVRIFVDGNVTIGYQTETSGFSAGELLVYATGDINLGQANRNSGQETSLSGFFFAQGDLETDYQAVINGGVSASQVELGQETIVSYEGGLLDAADFAPFCGDDLIGPDLVAYWRMDEAEWNGTAGEVVDQSGNGNDGTAQGDANTDDTSPALAGDPGTCGYGQFDGDGDYVSVPGLSNTLNATASLAFWIRTTQTGNDTGWQAPGVAGVEENGGADDIFWGWLDSQGRIGVSVANEFSTKSQTSINDGGWHHVVLTRDHQAGEFRVYIDGSLDADGSIATGVIGNSYEWLGGIRDTGGSHEFLEGDLDEVRLYDGVLELNEVQQIRDATHPCRGDICPTGTAEPGLMGSYYDTQDLDDVRDQEPDGTRVDGPIEFTWNGGDGPSVLGGQGSDFSILWNGRLLVTETGNYEFSVISDDGVRLILDGQTIIDEWNDQDDTQFDSPNQSLQAGQVYDLQLEHYENTGDADIELYWSRTGGGQPMGQTLIPAGNSQGTAPGLYHCPDTAVAYYTLDSTSPGLTCESQPVTITARDSDGNAMAPQAGTEIELGVSPGGSGATWVGGDFYTFSGTEDSVVRYLSHTDPTTVTPEVAETTGSATGVGDAIDFVDQALRFYPDRNDTSTPALLPDQVAAVEDPDPVVRVVRTDDESGSCEAAMTDQDRAVDLAFECRDPTQCIAGQTLTLDGNAVAANDLNAGPAYSAVTLTFDSDGFAPIPLEYSDVGQVRLYGRVNVPVENDPDREVTVTGESNNFVVRPETLVVTSVTDNGGTDAPGWGSNSGQDPQSAGFVAAGEAFSVTVEARNADGNLTPNFGNETSPEGVRLADDAALIYPAGGSIGNLVNVADFSRSGPGEFLGDTLTWDNVGTITVTPLLADDDYLGAGDLIATTQSDELGRFYPWDYTVTAGTSADACGGFSYLHQDAIELGVTLTARNLSGGTVSNYDNDALAYQQTALPSESGLVAENDDAGNGSVFTGRVQASAFEGEWSNGIGGFTTDDAQVQRANTLNGRQPGTEEGPWPSLLIGLTAVNDPFDGRPLVGFDMNPDTSGDCAGPGNCDAAALGGTLDLRFGRLRLEDAFGPEVVDLPVPFYTEYWNGSEWQRSGGDSCTMIPRSDITYQPTGTLDDDDNRTVPIGDGDTTGEYADLDTDGVNFLASDAEHYFTAPGAGNTGSFEVDVDLTDRAWLRFDWNQDGDTLNDTALPPARVGFGSYRGHDRIIYWREVLE